MTFLSAILARMALQILFQKNVSYSILALEDNITVLTLKLNHCNQLDNLRHRVSAINSKQGSPYNHYNHVFCSDYFIRKR